MPNIEHSSLTAAELHEPKGVSSASSGDVYVADGAGSGTWATAQLNGFEDYNHSGTPQPLTSGVYTKLQNDGAGSFTNTSYGLANATGAVWDTSTHQFHFDDAGLVVGDLYSIRFDLSPTTAAANTQLLLRLTLDVGGLNIPLDIAVVTYKTAGTYRWVSTSRFYIGSTATLTGPAEVSLSTDTSGNSVVVNGWAVFLEPKYPLFVTGA